MVDPESPVVNPRSYRRGSVSFDTVQCLFKLMNDTLRYIHIPAYNVARSVIHKIAVGCSVYCVTF